MDSESFNRSQNKDFSSVPRNNTRRITLGPVAVGGGAPVSVQTMTNTDTRDVKSTVSCIKEVMDAGCDIVRLAVPDAEAAAALSEIRKQTRGVPLVADIHFDWRLAMLSLDAGIDGLRINPGNIGGGEKVRRVAKAANERNVPIRIGVNGGSLEPELLQQYGGATPEALVDSALRHVTILENADFGNIKISVKASDVHRTVAAYRLLSSRTCYPLHLGLTEAGTFLAGTVRSSVAMGILLSEGIGDTVRISLTDTPLKEVIAGQEILRCLSLRAPGPNVTSCPTCGRTQADVINTAIAVEAALEKLYREEPAIARPHVAVMGCVVNGPGEARDADIALVGGNNFFYLYIRGERVLKVSEEEAVRAVVEAVREYK